MQNLSFSPAEIIEALTGQNGAHRKIAMRCLFDDQALRKKAIAHVRKHGGNRQDGEDVFQEAIIVFDRKVRQGAFRSEGSLEAYFMGIVRWYWYNEQHRPGRETVTATSDIPPEPPTGGNPELEYLLTERRENLEGLLELLADKCRNLLKLYQLDYSMDEIAREMGFANSNVAKKEASLCRKRFRALLLQHPELWK